MDRRRPCRSSAWCAGMTLPMLALPTVFLGALNLVLVPRLAYSTALNRPEEVRRRAGRAMLAVSVLILPSMALMVVLGPDLARMMFGQPSAGGTPAPPGGGHGAELLPVHPWGRAQRRGTAGEPRHGGPDL